MANPSAITFPSVVIQNCTFTAKRQGNMPTITFANTATAGSETVSVDSSYNITIGIQSGVTTPAQLKTAILNSKSPDGTAGTVGDLVSISTTGSTALVSAVSVPLTGGVTTSTADTAKIGSLLYTAKTAGASSGITVTYGATIPITVTTVTDSTHLVVSSTTGFVANVTVLKQSTHSCTVTTVTDGTHVVTTTNTGFTGSGASATASTIEGHEVVAVSSSAISVYFQDGVTTYGQVISAIAGNSPANALVSVASTGPSTNNKAHVANAVGTISLAGGTTAAAASCTIQGVTITSASNSAAVNGLTLTLTGGGTAGSETGSLDSHNNITLQIQVGTSTVTQIVAALNAITGFSVLYTATGSASTHPTTVYQTAITGAVNPNTSGFYADANSVTLTTTYQYLPFSGNARSLVITNDEASGSKFLSYSFDGINVHGIVNPTNIITLSNPNKTGIYVKYVTGSPAFRIIAVNS